MRFLSEKSNTNMSFGDLARVAPSIFSNHAGPKTSDRYTFVPTIDAVEMLVRSGWQPTSAGEARVRDEQGKGFQVHQVKFRHPDHSNDTPVKVGDFVNPQLILINSHNAQSSFQIKVGLHRLVCSNGLVVSGGGFEQKVRHLGYSKDKFLSAVSSVADKMPEVVVAARQMSEIELSPERQMELAVKAAVLRFGGDYRSRLSAEDLLPRRRNEDSGKDAWTVFNVLQENCVKGGIKTLNDNWRHAKTRRLSSLGSLLKFNQSFWETTQDYLKLTVNSN